MLKEGRNRTGGVKYEEKEGREDAGKGLTEGRWKINGNRKPRAMEMKTKNH